MEYEKLDYRQYWQNLSHNEKYLSSAISHASGYHSWALFPSNPAAVNLWVHGLISVLGFCSRTANFDVGGSGIIKQLKDFPEGVRLGGSEVDADAVGLDHE